MIAAGFAILAPQIAVDRYHAAADYLQAIIAVSLGVVFGISALRRPKRIERAMGLIGLVVCGTLLLNMLVGYLRF